MFLFAINIGGAFSPIFDAGSVAVFVHGIQWLGYTLHFPAWLTVFLARGAGRRGEYRAAAGSPAWHDVPVYVFPRRLRVYGARRLL